MFVQYRRAVGVSPGNVARVGEWDRQAPGSCSSGRPSVISMEVIVTLTRAASVGCWRKKLEWSGGED